MADLDRRRHATPRGLEPGRSCSTGRTTGASGWPRTPRRATRSAPRSRGSGRRGASLCRAAIRAFDLHPDGERLAVADGPGGEAEAKRDHARLDRQLLRRAAPARAAPRDAAIEARHLAPGTTPRPLRDHWRPSARAGWARSTAPPTRSSAARSRSRCCPRRSRPKPERLARFEREAQLLASLNHPNIAARLRLRGATLEDGAAVTSWPWSWSRARTSPSG